VLCGPLSLFSAHGECTLASVLGIPFFRPKQITGLSRHFISPASARIRRFSLPPPRGLADRFLWRVLLYTSNWSWIDCYFFHKLLPPETAASILWCLAIPQPPNCSPPPLLAYKMVAYATTPRDGRISPTVRHRPGSFRRNEECCIASPPKIDAG
jgi:hypothetical protein